MTALLALWATYLFFFKPQLFWAIVFILWLIYQFVVNPVSVWIILGLIAAFFIIVFIVAMSNRDESKDDTK